MDGSDRWFAVGVALAEHAAHPGTALSTVEAVEIALDAAQDALLRHDGRESGKFSYMSHAIKWKLRDVYKSPRVRPAQLPPARVEHDFAPAAIDRVAARSLVLLLTDKQRHVIFALYFAGLTVDQAAEWLDLPRTAVISLRHRALERMRKAA